MFDVSQSISNLANGYLEQLTRFIDLYQLKLQLEATKEKRLLAQFDHSLEKQPKSASYRPSSDF